MAILVDHQIRALLRETKPLVSNIPPTGYKRLSGGISSCGYDAHLACEFADVDNLHAKALSGDSIVDPTMQHQTTFLVLDELNEENQAKIKTRTGHEITTLVLWPDHFVLARTIETFNIPNNLMATVEGKSTLLRCGLVVHPSIIEPGFSGTITLEISNLGMNPIALPVTWPICQIQFHTLAERPTRTYPQRGGKYQNQQAVTGPLLGTEGKLKDTEHRTGKCFHAGTKDR